MPDVRGPNRQWTRAFPSQAASVANARRFLGEVLQDAEICRDQEAAILMLSELATNAVRHAHSVGFAVSVLQTADGLFIGVTDDDPDPPVLSTARREEGGLGLSLIELLSEQWGVTRETKGKCVWFKVPFE